MSFRLVPKSVTLNGVMALFCVISANSGSFRAHCVKLHAISSPDEFLLYHFNREQILHATVIQLFGATIKINGVIWQNSVWPCVKDHVALCTCYLKCNLFAKLYFRQGCP